MTATLTPERRAPLSEARAEQRASSGFATDGPRVVVLGDVVADATGFRIDAVPLVEAALAPGQELQLVYRYNFVETGVEQDFFRASLVARVGDAKPAPKLFQVFDRKGLKDDAKGALVQRFAFRAPGVYDGGFAVHGELIQQAWGTPEVLGWKSLTKQGALEIRVG
ncbi:MAG: hypothetical protein ACYDCK_10605 [Thermoplasmatota archaeon]